MVDLWLRLSLLFMRHAGSRLKAHNLWISKRPWPRDTDFSVSRKGLFYSFCVWFNPIQSPVSVRVAHGLWLISSSLKSQWQSAHAAWYWLAIALSPRPSSTSTSTTNVHRPFLGLARGETPSHASLKTLPRRKQQQPPTASRALASTTAAYPCHSGKARLSFQHCHDAVGRGSVNNSGARSLSGRDPPLNHRFTRVSRATIKTIIINTIQSKQEWHHDEHFLAVSSA